MNNYKSYKIFLIGKGQSYDIGTFFYEELRALNFTFDFVDYKKYYPTGSTKLQRAYMKIFGRYLYPLLLNNEIRKRVEIFKPDVAIIIKGSKIWFETLFQIKSIHNTMLVNYATDDPIALQESAPEIYKSIPIFDLYASTKKMIIDDIKKGGCKNVIFLPFAYQPNQHYPEHPKNQREIDRFNSDIVFIGGGDEDRIPYMKAISKIPGIRLDLYGGYWDRYPELAQFYKGFAINRDYRLAMSGTKIAPGLVRRKNRDGHSMRTFEVPACSTFLLAERTEEHQEIFVEGRDVELFSTMEELINKILFYLKNDTARQRIAKNGYLHITSGKNTYQDRLLKILSYIS